MDASLVSRFNDCEKKELNKSAIKDFSINARRKLIEGVSQKAYQIGISKDEIKEIEEIPDGARLEINNETIYLTNKEYENRQKLIGQIELKGYEQVMEEVSYTWFNRIIAIRFMEVNNYLPTEIRILSSEDENKKEPDAVSQVMSIADELDLKLDKIYKLQDDNDVNGLFKYIFVKQCNSLGKIMPVMFEKIEDYTELLLPDGLLLEGNVVNDLINDIDEDDFTNQVEIIGWMYQYYMTEKKEQVFADLKKNIKITKENIPAATQLYTPDWIVKYMVENSLGRLWLEGHPDEELKDSFKYYLEEAKQEPKVEAELEKIRKESAKLSPEEITVLDPAMGSGHILVYAFDILYQIYLSAGYSEREIPRLILEKNLYGIDIDDRAGQLSYFALIMKARSYSRRLFRDMERNHIELNVCSIQESNILTMEDIEYLADSDEGLKRDINYLVDVFTDAKEYGSILEVEKVNESKIFSRLIEVREKVIDLFNKDNVNNILNILPLIMKQNRIINKKYYICITNPPYMGRNGMNIKLGKYLDSNYQDYKSDLFSVFIKRGFDYIRPNGFNAMVTMQSWMFLSSLEKLRKYILDNKSIISLTHMGNNVMGIAFGTSAFILRNTRLNYNGIYNAIDSCDLNEKNIPKKFPVHNRRYININSNEFYSIPGAPIAYWVSNNVRSIFEENKTFEQYGKPRQGMATADNNRFLRKWNEVEFNNIGLGFESGELASKSGLKWFPYNKGGNFRKWYGNNEYVLNWKNDGTELKSYKSAVLRNQDFYFKKGITWTLISSSNKFGVRYTDRGFLFDVGGSSAFPSEERIYYSIGLLSSKLGISFLKIQNPTLNFQVGNIANIPTIIPNDSSLIKKIDFKVKECIEKSRRDWDSFEDSWDFKKHPIIEFISSNIEKSFNSWLDFTEKQFNQLKSNEEELNRIFIDIYGLQDELTPEVEDKDITIRKADRDREMKSFISYAVGCMMGRYSLDEEGLVYAGGELDINKYKTFKADKDAIIPITDDEYFEDDIVSKFVEFVKVVFGEETLEQNLNYIADTNCFKRKANENSRDVLRRYFLKGFMEDHIKVYQKRPIYWMFDSGKQNGFKELIYMHRYDENMVAKIRTDYLHKMQGTYEAEIIRLEKDIDSEVLSTREKTLAKKKKGKIAKQLDECRTYDQVIAHVANQRISIDLDDGVKFNYNKFQGIEILQGEGRKLIKADLLFKVKI